MMMILWIADDVDLNMFQPILTEMAMLKYTDGDVDVNIQISTNSGPVW